VLQKAALDHRELPSASGSGDFCANYAKFLAEKNSKSNAQSLCGLNKSIPRWHRSLQKLPEDASLLTFRKVSTGDSGVEVHSRAFSFHDFNLSLQQLFPQELLLPN